MAVTDYTTYDDIRAALGVSTTELPDSVLATPQWGLMLPIDFEEVNAGIPDLYATISAISAGSRTKQQQRFYDLCRLFATYSISNNLLASLPLFSVWKLSDGKADFQRQRDIYEETVDGVMALFNTTRLRMSAAFVLLDSSEAQFTTTLAAISVGATLGSDPVTGA